MNGGLCACGHLMASRDKGRGLYCNRCGSHSSLVPLPCWTAVLVTSDGPPSRTIRRNLQPETFVAKQNPDTRSGIRQCPICSGTETFAGRQSHCACQQTKSEGITVDGKQLGRTEMRPCPCGGYIRIANGLEAGCSNPNHGQPTNAISCMLCIAGNRIIQPSGLGPCDNPYCPTNKG